MANPISGLGNPNSMTFPMGSPGLGASSLANGQSSFEKLLLDSLSEVNDMQHAASSAIETRITGGDITSVEVYSAVKKADLSLRMMLQIRNKVMQAYNEIKEMRM